MAERPQVSEATLRAHDAVVRRLAGAVDAILPVRFGSLLSESGLADLLTARGRELSEALALVAGREQMTLRLLGAATAPTAPAPPPDDLGPGARYLAARRAEWRRAREAPGLEPPPPRLGPPRPGQRGPRPATPPPLPGGHHPNQP